MKILEGYFMKKFILVLLSVLLALSFFSCENDTQPSSSESSSVDYPSEEEILELLEKSLSEIFNIGTEDPFHVLYEILGSDLKSLSYDNEIDGKFYIETNGSYSELETYYAQFFTDEALEWIISIKFKNVDGKVYCDISGGMTGVGASDITITEIGENSYKADYYVKGWKSYSSCSFKIKETHLGYRISEIDFRVFWQ